MKIDVYGKDITTNIDSDKNPIAHMAKELTASVESPCSNAVLIAAAPEMYEALKICGEALLKHGLLDTAAFEAVVKATEKVEGRV